MNCLHFALINKPLRTRFLGFLSMGMRVFGTMETSYFSPRETNPNSRHKQATAQCLNTMKTFTSCPHHSPGSRASLPVPPSHLVTRGPETLPLGVSCTAEPFASSTWGIFKARSESGVHHLCPHAIGWNPNAWFHLTASEAR